MSTSPVSDQERRITRLRPWASPLGAAATATATSSAKDDVVVAPVTDSPTRRRSNRTLDIELPADKDALIKESPKQQDEFDQEELELQATIQQQDDLAIANEIEAAEALAYTLTTDESSTHRPTSLKRSTAAKSDRKNTALSNVRRLRTSMRNTRRSVRDSRDKARLAVEEVRDIRNQIQDALQHHYINDDDMLLPELDALSLSESASTSSSTFGNNSFSSLSRSSNHSQATATSSIAEEVLDEEEDKELTQFLKGFLDNLIEEASPIHYIQ